MKSVNYSTVSGLWSVVRRQLLLNIENLVLRARSEFNGFAGKDCELIWSTGVLKC